jgi:hypothetical protein
MRSIPTHDPQTGELNPYYEELTGEKNPLSKDVENESFDIPRFVGRKFRYNGKLIKTDVNYLLEDDKGVVVASTSTKEGINGLSKQNCDEIFGVVDVIDVVYKQVRNGFDGDIDSFTEAFAKECINRAMKLYQPTEIEVEIEMECLDPNCDGINKKGVCIHGDKPKIDSNGCLILKKL